MNDSIILLSEDILSFPSQGSQFKATSHFFYGAYVTIFMTAEERVALFDQAE